MEPSLDLLLSKRDYDYMSFTKKAIETFGSKLTKALQMHLKTERNITWFRVERYKGIDGFVIVMGDVEVVPGDMVNTPEGGILATEENYKNLTNTARYILSSKVLQQGNPEAIYQHIVFIETLAREATEEQIHEILSNEIFDSAALIENPQMQAIVNRITRPTVFESFDTSNLTEEQYNTLRLCAGSQSKSRQ